MRLDLFVDGLRRLAERYGARRWRQCRIASVSPPSPAPQSMQKLLRERRIFAWDSWGQFLGAMFAFTTSPQFGQQRTVTTMRPWLSLAQRF